MPALWTRLGPAHRTPVLVSAVLLATALAGLGTGAALGAAGGGGDDGATVTAAAAGSSRVSGDAASRSHRRTRAASEIERGTREDVGYLVGAQQEGDGLHVTFDRVLLKLGRDARVYARATDKPPPGPDGILLVNDNPLTRDLVVSPDVRVTGGRTLAASDLPRAVTLQRLLDEVATDGRQLLLDLRYDRLGYLTEISEHDLP